MEQETGNVEYGFQKLQAWQKADDLAAEIFRLTEEQIPDRHRWLSVQIVRAAFSVTANISEGYGRSSLGDYLRFLEIAGASLNEVENALHFIKRNKVLPTEAVKAAEELRWATGNLLFGLSRSLRSRLKAKGAWQRGISEKRSEHGTTTCNGDDQHVPGSKFHEPEASHGEG